MQAMMLWIVRDFSGEDQLPETFLLQHNTPHSFPLKNHNKLTDWDIESRKIDKEGTLSSSAGRGCSSDWESKHSFQSTSQEV